MLTALAARWPIFVKIMREFQSFLDSAGAGGP
jgi:hypothetical protein